MSDARDHGGALDAAVARWGGVRDDWLDLSTGINPVPYPLPPLTKADWCALPDRSATAALENAARRFWRVPDPVSIVAAPGASSLIAALPRCLEGQRVRIRPDTYNEHAAAFCDAGWKVVNDAGDPTDPAELQVVVHPNNPTGTFARGPFAKTCVIDESFCDTRPEASHVPGIMPGMTVLKSFGKFWGLAGLRLGFAIGDADLIGALRRQLGPWPVAGPALAIGKRALDDDVWSEATRTRLHRDAARLDRLMGSRGAESHGDCPLFRLYHVEDAAHWQDRFARHRILARTFPYNPRWLRLGLPAPSDWPRLERACGTVGGASAQPSVAPRP